MREVEVNSQTVAKSNQSYLPMSSSQNHSQSYLSSLPMSTSHNQSQSNLTKLRLGDNIDNLDDNGFPIKQGFKHKALSDQYVISYTIASGKVTKLQVNNAANGQLVIDTSLARWEDKR